MISLRLLVAPLLIDTLPFDTPTTDARKRVSSLLAAPSVAAAPIRTCRLDAEMDEMDEVELPGLQCTYTLRPLATERR